ncbi:hypothetical protein BT96DRAFT_605181 [Gymnopus androsaceus JB14]|uniref:Uncharacterized protein n=1 Tax=Gymnopus androsaceus JB14 TaxID=1447944 RepID=A0A6A4GIM6_9AGAR|nr:hypothetical protein BT96DRAFT_605181 [Gymnopus androsaceus JB14]
MDGLFGYGLTIAIVCLPLLDAHWSPFSALTHGVFCMEPIYEGVVSIILLGFKCIAQTDPLVCTYSKYVSMLIVFRRLFSTVGHLTNVLQKTYNSA